MSCAAPPPPPRPAPAAAPAASGASAALAPGFRFHPTDEELVSYYLRRKVAGRPFRVDAIADVDLYKMEPWDLPGRSRLQSRDTEWYFFSALDKKYANRSRTNRATGSGYWKTTGKDRAVCRGGRTVGMKKTLVFHIGRAPKGERTNWVMHEYRLEDDDLARAGIPQDAFVVCRIFQKKGPGPQNGAQYGAPFVEEEWEEEDELPVLKEEDGGDGFHVLGGSVPAETGDHEQIQDASVNCESTALLIEPGELDDFNDFFDPDSLLKICEDKVLSNETDENIEVPGQQSDPNLEGIVRGSDAVDQNQSIEVLNDEFLELNDFAYPMDTNGQEGLVCPEEMHNDANFINGEIGYQQELHTLKAFLNTDNEINDPSEMFPPSQTAQNNYFVEMDDLLGPETGHYASGKSDSDEIPFFDASSHYLDADHGSSADVNNVMDSTIASSSGLDLVDELIAYFDTTENMQSSDLDLTCETDTSNQSNLALVNGHNKQAYQTSAQPGDINGGNSSSSGIPNADKQSSDKSVDIHGGSVCDADTQYDNSWDKAFTKRLVSMLGAISSPPAFAAEYPLKHAKSIEDYSAAQPSSSMRVAAGMVQIHGVAMSGTGKSWSMLKSRDAGFLLSYGMTSDETGNLAGYDTMPKMPGGIMPFILRNSFHLLFLSVLFLAASFKIWVYIYGR